MSEAIYLAKRLEKKKKKKSLLYVTLSSPKSTEVGKTLKKVGSGEFSVGRRILWQGTFKRSEAPHLRSSMDTSSGRGAPCVCSEAPNLLRRSTPHPKSRFGRKLK